MNSKILNQILLLLTYFATQHGVINAMKRPHAQISTSKTAKQLPPLKKTKLNNKTAALLCTLCNKTFSTSNSLTIHQRTHTGEKPYKCDVCNKAFSQKSHLTVHQRTHTGEKPYKCDVCDKSFSQSNDLTRHQKIHTSEKHYTCDICNKTFSRKNTLTDHNKTHTGEKPYKCTTCNKIFSQKGNLTGHEKTHIKIITPTISLTNNNAEKMPIHMINNSSSKSFNTPTNYQDIIENIMTLNDNDTEFNKWIGK